MVFSITIHLGNVNLDDRQAVFPTFQQNVILSEVNKPTKSIKCALLSPILQSFLLFHRFVNLNLPP